MPSVHHKCGGGKDGGEGKREEELKNEVEGKMKGAHTLPSSTQLGKVF